MPGLQGEKAGTPPTALDRITALGGVAVLLLVIATVAFASHNRGLQDTVSAGQATLAKAQTAANLDNTLIRMLTSAAVERDDADIKALLAANGVTYRQTAAATAPADTKTTEDAK